MEQFTVEEMNLMCMYQTDNREKLIEEINSCLPYVEDTDMQELVEQVIKKLENMTDEEYAQVIFVYTEEDK